MSLLGNKNESSHSTTKAAIGDNIAITLTQDPNAAQTLATLNRDTQNANEKVTKHDLTQVQETQELVKGIGEIANKAMQIYSHAEKEKVEQAKLEVGKVETRLRNEGKTEAEIAKNAEYLGLKQQLDTQQKAFDAQFGTGSKTKRAVDAVTAALQGLAAKDAGQAVVGLASPYLNEQISIHTKNPDGSVNKEVNLLSHALLGAVEAVATGNNALAGAVAGAGSEAAAIVITNTLYPNKKTSELTESEKHNVVFLSQLAGGLAAGLAGDSTQSVASGVDIGKRAVENNYLDAQDAARQLELSMLILTEADPKKRQEYLEEQAQLNKKDQESQQAIENNCQRFNKGSAECQASIADANKAKKSYFLYPKEPITNPSGLADSRSYKQLLPHTFRRVEGALEGKDPATLQKEASAVAAAKINGTSPEQEYRWVSNGIDLGVFSTFDGWGRAIKGLPYKSSGIDTYHRRKVGDVDYPESIHFSAGLKKHLVNDDKDIDRKMGIVGTHNKDNFMDKLIYGKGKVVKVAPTGTEGIMNIYYSIPRLGRDKNPDGTYKIISSPKTVYDPHKISDETILDMGQKAAAKKIHRKFRE